MNPASLLMIHNAWSSASGNAEELRKAAADLDVISEASAEAYKAKISIPAEQLKALMDAEPWIAPADAAAWGFATEVLEEEPAAAVSQSARSAVFQALTRPPVPEPEPKTVATFLSALRKGGKE